MVNWTEWSAICIGFEIIRVIPVISKSNERAEWIRYDFRPNLHDP